MNHFELPVFLFKYSHTQVECIMYRTLRIVFLHMISTAVEICLSLLL